MIAACLPTLHNLAVGSSIRSASSTVRSILKLDSFRSNTSTSSRPVQGRVFSEIEAGTGGAKPSYREIFEKPEDMTELYTVTDLESGPRIPPKPSAPNQVHVVS